MYKPIALFISLRYMHGRILDCFGRCILWLSIIGISLGVMAIIIVLSVMNGFEKNLENNILGFMPHALITNKQGSLNPQLLTALVAQELQGVSHVAPLTTADVILQSAHSIAICVMLGINSDNPDPLTPYLVNIKQQQLKKNQYNIILGDRLASTLKVKYGDLVRLTVPSTSQFTPIGRIPSQRLFTIIGTFHANSEVDNYLLLVNQEDASHLMHYPNGNITGWRLFLHKPLMVGAISTQKLPQGAIWQDWRERKGELFQAVHMEKHMMGLLLSLIIMVALFNIITSLSFLVIGKQKEIAILQTQGLTCSKIMAIFILYGVNIGLIGSLIGIFFGILLASNLNNIMLTFSIWMNYIKLPVVIDALQIIYIAIITIASSLISALYPSWHAATVQPAIALRYE